MDYNPHHYENFPVASLLLPFRLRRPVRIIYAFARQADDFADEGNLAPEERLNLLQNFRNELDCIRNHTSPESPLFSDIAGLVTNWHLPLEPFYDLLDAFSQDVTKTRYANFGEVMDYCRRSANPVGRLLLHLYDAATPRNLAYSDGICSSLQLINFLQDVAIDYRKNRIYLPQDELAQYGISETQIAEGSSRGLWKPFMLFQVERARKLLQAGAPLGKILKGRIGLELRMIIMGGESILRKLHHEPDVFSRRPVLTKKDWVYMLYRALLARQYGLKVIVTPDQYCQDKAASSGSSFYYSFLFLPPEKRRAITAFYAFCREVDDIADECSDPEIARTKLNWWRHEIANAISGNPQHPVSRALLPGIREYDLHNEQFQEIIDGMEMDLIHKRYADFKSLTLYCYRVASVVGQISASIFGYEDRHTLKYANDLGLAFQLTNIIRDVGEDARRGRIYLPQDELKQFGVEESDILAGRKTENFLRLMSFQIERANRYYDQAFSSLPSLDRKNQRPGLVMAAIYRTVLNKIKSDSGQVLHRHISLTPLRKLWIAWRTWVKA